MRIEVINLIEIKQKLNDLKHFKVYRGGKNWQYYYKTSMLIINSNYGYLSLIFIG